MKAGSPVEIQAELCNLAWLREATRRVGRPGMPLQGSTAVTACADIAGSSQEYGWRSLDARCVWLYPQLKTSYQSLCRAAHFMEYGTPGISWGTGYIGGLAGGPEGAAVTAVAETLAAQTLYQTTLDYVGPIHSLYLGTSNRLTLWATPHSNAAVNKNTNHLTIGEGPYITYAGPCTPMCLYEIAATTIGVTVTGGNPFGVAPLQGTGRGDTDYHRFGVEVYGGSRLRCNQAEAG